MGHREGEGFQAHASKQEPLLPLVCAWEFPGLPDPPPSLSAALTLLESPYLRLALQGFAWATLVPDDLCLAFLAHFWEFRGKPQRETKQPWLLLVLWSGQAALGARNPSPLHTE